MEKLYENAFKVLNLLEEEDFELDAIEDNELKDFLDDEEEETVDIIDPMAEDEEDVKDSYMDKVVLECSVCHSLIYKDPSEIVEDEESEDGLVNTGDECPYCMSTDGYKIVGQIAPYETTDVTVEVEPKDEEEGEEEVEVEDDTEEVTESFKRKRARKNLTEAFAEPSRIVIRASGPQNYSKQRLNSYIKNIVNNCTFKPEILYDAEDTVTVTIPGRQDWINKLSDMYEESAESNVIIDLGESLKNSNVRKSLKESDNDPLLISSNGNFILVNSSGVGINDTPWNGLEVISRKNARKHVVEIRLDSNFPKFEGDPVHFKYWPDSVSVTHGNRMTRDTLQDTKEYILVLQEAIDFSKMVSDFIKNNDEWNAEVSYNKNFGESLNFKTMPIPKNGATFAFRATVDEPEISRLLQKKDLKFSKVDDNGTIVWLIGYGDTDHIATYVPSTKTLYTDSRELFRESYMTNESLNEDTKYRDLYFGGINFKLKDAEDKKMAKQLIDSTFGGMDIEGGFFKINKTKSGYLLKYFGNIGSIYYEEYFKDFIRKMKSAGIEITYEPKYSELELIFNRKDHIDSLEDEQKVQAFLNSKNESLDEAFDINSMSRIKLIDAIDEFYREDEIDNYIIDDKTMEDILDENGASEDDSDPDEGLYYSMSNEQLKNVFQIIRNYLKTRDEDEYNSYSSDIYSMFKLKRGWVDESLENLDIETEHDKIHIEAEEKTDDSEEMIVPIDPEVEDEIEDNSELVDSEEEPNQEDVDIEEFDEESFDELGESFLKKHYSNVSSFKTTKIFDSGNNLFVEGLITFNSGSKKNTSFKFTPSTIRNNKVKFFGENLQINNGKKAFKLNGRLDNNKLIAESLTYNYIAKNQKNESKRVSGTVSLKESKVGKDLSKKEGSMSNIIEKNLNKINASASKDELLNNLTNIFKDNGLDTEASKRLLLNVKKSKSLTAALSTVYNSYLAGSNLAVDRK